MRNAVPALRAQIFVNSAAGCFRAAGVRCIHQARDRDFGLCNMNIR